MAIRVHLADDHTMFREGLAAIFASREGIEVVGQSSTGGEDTFALVEENKPDVVITQIDVELKTAMKTLCGIRSASPDSKIIVLTMSDNVRYLQALSNLGIGAYVHKSSSSEELLAYTDALSRKPCGDNMVISMPSAFLERMGEGQAGTLSERELEVLVLVARGLSNVKVATELGISEATVKRHLANVYAKMAVRSRSEAVRKALAEQWIGLGEITAAGSYGSSGNGFDGDGSSGG